jgi:hypothetical protein
VRYFLIIGDTVLIEFTVGNFRSIRNKVTLSLVASSIKEHCTSNTMPLNSKTSLLKSAVIYGANASGKSNVLKALRFMRKFVINSSKDMQANEAIDVVNFKLSCDTESSPSSFEVIFCQESLCYKYGFEVTKNEVLKEWLYYYNKNKEIKLFLRTNDQFDLGDDFKEGEDIIRKTRQNALFLSVVAQFNGEIAQKILRWFNLHCGTLPPEWFKQFILPSYQRRCEKLHTAGKFVHSHWDGDTKAFLPFAKETGLDGIEAITPQPQGDVTLEEIKYALGDDMFLLDGIPAILFDEIYDTRMLEEYANKIIELFAPKLVLGISDEISSTGDIERIRIVGNVVDKHNSFVCS